MAFYHNRFLVLQYIHIFNNYYICMYPHTHTHIRVYVCVHIRRVRWLHNRNPWKKVIKKSNNDRICMYYVVRNSKFFQHHPAKEGEGKKVIVLDNMLLKSDSILV